MVFRRPLLYLSMPGVAFILGLLWYRRRNKNNSSDKIVRKQIPANDQNFENISSSMEIVEDFLTKTIANNVQTVKNGVSQSVNIKCSTFENEEQNFINRHFGKSAPIKIIQNGRGGGSSPANQLHTRSIDSEVLRTKIQDVEYKVLRSIDEEYENLSSPVDLPDSVNNRLPFYTRNVDVAKEKPVVIRANANAKVSPENSFLETKYTDSPDPKMEQKDEDLEGNCEAEHLSSKEEMDPINNDSDETQSKLDVVPTKECNEEDNGNDTAVANTTVAVANVTSSPSLSSYSVHSGDSGKGSSLPRSEATRAKPKATYEFLFPYSLIGLLYGSKRSFIAEIKEKTNANVFLRRVRIVEKVHVCVLEGTENEIQAALAMIRDRLPTKSFPNFTMQRILFATPRSVVPLPNLVNLQLHLIEGINNDVTVSSIISAGHIFVQHPLHPSHPSLDTMQKFLFDTYNNTESPLLPGIELSAVCVMPVNGHWYRVQIVDHDPKDEQRCVVKFLDYGGYMNIHFNELRQIRSDLMTLPFQSTECLLSNIAPIGDFWTREAADILFNLTKGRILQAQVAGYNNMNIPEIYIFVCLGPQNIIFVNKELVARNLAKWVKT